MSKNLFRSMALLAVLSTMSASAAETPLANVILGVHGGTGIAKKDMIPGLEKSLRADLERALAAGHQRLQQAEGTGLDAVEAAIRVLEDSPLFNAGKGSVFNHEGRNELDASIMEGKTKRAGAVAGVTVIRNPISAARAVMEKSPHVLLIGPGAEAFATQAGLEIVEPGYFWTEPRWRQIQEIWEKEAAQPPQNNAATSEALPRQWGTVGAVALDRAGNLAAGTSTGGMVNKMFGRVGDSPIIGAGTYADNESCAISATGHGEFFIRFTVAHEIGALIKYKGMNLSAAASQVIHGQLKAVGGEGGVIGIDARGNFTMPYNCEGMYRGCITRDGKITVQLYEK